MRSAIRHCHPVIPVAVLLCALMLTPAAPGLADEPEEIPLETEVVSATVYGGQAQIVRRGEVELGSGSLRIVCPDIPEKLIDTSLNVEGMGLADARIVGIDLRRTEEKVVDSPRFVELSSELEEIQAAMGDLKIRKRAIERRIELLRSVANFSTDQTEERLKDGTFTMSEWRGLLSFFEDESAGAERRQAELDDERRKLQERADWVGSELRKMQITEGSGREVVIDCETTAAGIMTLELSYLVPDASWAPEYTIRHIERDSEVELSYSARIAQATGEDWNEVAVLLSTAAPHVGAAPPELSPQYLGMTTGTIQGQVSDARTSAPLAWANVLVKGTRHGTVSNSEGTYVIPEVRAGTCTVVASYMGYEHVERSNVRVVAGRTTRVNFSMRPLVLTSEEAVVEAERPMIETTATARQPGVVLHEGEIHVRGGRASEVEMYAEAPPTATHVEAEVAASEYAANLVIPKPVDLETGAEPRRALVVRERLPGRFVLQAVPRLSDHVFVRGTFTNALEVPILPGSAEVYVESVPGGGDVEISNFVGRDRLDAVAPGEEFTLYLGTDQNVKVQHELVSREILSKEKDSKRKLHYAYAITIESFRREPATVRVVDRVPVSAMKDIRVADLEIAPEPTEHGENGILVWELTLEPGARKEFTWEYRIEYPSTLAARELGLEE